jgi:hypothetical protein
MKVGQPPEGGTTNSRRELKPERRTQNGGHELSESLLTVSLSAISGGHPFSRGGHCQGRVLKPTAPIRRSKVVLSLRERNEAWGKQNTAGNPGARGLAAAFCSSRRSEMATLLAHSRRCSNRFSNTA